MPFIFNAFSQSAAAIDKNKVMSYFQDQAFEDALHYLTPALASDSNNISLLGYTGYAYYMNDNKKAAEDCYRHIFQLDSNNIPALSYLVRLTMDDKDTAMNFTRRLLVLQPDKAVWWRTMGELWRRAQNTDTALDYLTRAHDLAPNDAKNIAALADVLIDKRYYPLSDSLLDGALSRDSLNINFLRLRIRSAYTAGDYETVLVPGERLVRLDVPAAVSGSLTWLALSYYNLKKYPDCIRVCEYMLQSGLELESIYYYEARARAKLKEYEKSNDLLATCLTKAISKTADWYYYDLGQNYEGLKNFKEAIANYDTAYYLFKDPTMLYNCGRIAESELRNMPLARKYYLRYLAAAHPKDPEEKKAYAYVRSRWGAGGKTAGKKGKF
ncbi:MAG TPA: tetratricopeptide repeat protein [Puia sp.]|jgi:tetratricopeptide (TPR) repeat protein